MSENNSHYPQSVARLVLLEYGITQPLLRRLNQEYNTVFEVISDGHKSVLRLGLKSARTRANITAEIELLTTLRQSEFAVPIPIANRAGNFITEVWDDQEERAVLCVLFEWLNGEDVGDEPSLEQLSQAGSAMAQLHLAASSFTLPSSAALPSFRDFFWEVQDYLSGPDTKLQASDQDILNQARISIEQVLEDLYSESSPLVIHGDLHGWNMKWHEGKLAVLDFDDCGLGLEIQDLATTLYYLDTKEQDEAFLAGYRSIKQLPKHTPDQLAALLLQRRIQLLNYIYEVRTPELLEMLDSYQAETLRRAREYLAS